MAPEKEERSGAAVKKTGEAGDDSARRASGTQSRATARDSGVGGDGGPAASPPARRRERYIIGTRTAPGGQPMAHPQHSMDDVVQYLNQQENVEVVKRIKLGGTQPFTANGRSVNEVVVAKIDEGKAQRLRALAPSHLIIERDALLACADYQSVPARIPAIGTLLPLRSVATDISIRVIGERDQPLARATVVIDGGELPAQAITDETGTARVTFFGGSTEAIRALFIRAASNHWDRVIPAPRLGSGINTVKLRPLCELYPNFPTARLLGWGQRLMGIDPTVGRFSGTGVRIGLIDSGCDNSHPLLRHVVQGKDFTNGGTDASWTQDLVSHGTHCAGIINASIAEQGIVGCAPAAELHVFKVIPDGRVSDLLAALDECIERELDLINISVVSDEFSELLSQKLQEARQKGIACIVAAGNSGGPLAFPAMLPGVMAVAAVGKLREFPEDSSHVLSVVPQLIGRDDIFPAHFSGGGPQVAVSAPGVAIVSTVPGGYAAADGTSAAAAHVTGLAALVLAHHPLLQEGTFRVRSEQRVHALFELIRASALPHFPDPHRGGAGVPDLSRIPGGHGIALGLSFPDRVGAERLAMPTYWPLSVQGWPAWLPARAPPAGFLTPTSPAGWP
jgi:subtilisin